MLPIKYMSIEPALNWFQINNYVSKFHLCYYKVVFKIGMHSLMQTSKLSIFQHFKHLVTTKQDIYRAS